MNDNEKKKNNDNPTQHRMIGRRLSITHEYGERTFKFNSPVGNTLVNILGQFDQAYAEFKKRLGEPGGISPEDGDRIMQSVRDMVLDFSKLTSKLSRKTKLRYFPPNEIKDFKRIQEIESERNTGQ